ncbi:MAG: menaquinol-cytochrome C reductase [Chloroflexota bacterium]
MKSEGVSPQDKGTEERLFSWPHLLVWEALLLLGTTLVLLLMGMFITAPLRAIADPDVTENPAKAPWYFLNLQELLLHMNASMAGVIIPTLILIFLMAIPYLDRHKADVGLWFASEKGKKIALFTTAYTTVLLTGLILFNQYIRVKSLVPKFDLISWNMPILNRLYFIGEPDLLSGWVIPIAVMIGLIVLLTLILQRWLRPNGRELLIAYFTGFIATYVVLTIVDLFFRGYGMNLIAPWNLPPGGLSF